MDNVRKVNNVRNVRKGVNVNLAETFPLNGLLESVINESLDKKIRTLITASRREYGFILRYVKDKRRKNESHSLSKL